MMSTGDDHSDAEMPLQSCLVQNPMTCAEILSSALTTAHAVKRQLPKKGRKLLCTGQVFLGTHNLCQNLCPSRSK